MKYLLKVITQKRYGEMQTEIRQLRAKNKELMEWKSDWLVEDKSMALFNALKKKGGMD